MLYVFFTLILVRLLPVLLFFLIFWKIVRLLFSWTSGSWPPPGGPGGPGQEGLRQEGGSSPPPGSGGSRRRPRNPYEVLGCSPSATDDEVRKRYRKLLSRYHPDKFIGQGYDEEFVNLASRKFQEIQEAYETIRSSRRF